MSKQAVFEIVINGVKESIAAVDSLNKSLDALEKRIDALAKKNVNVSTSGGDTTARTKALEEEDRLLRQIDQLHQKVADTEKQEYQELLHAKEELKEYQTIAKSIAAQTNLDQGINDTNTMQGMKAQLHDIKAAMQTVDINSDQFKKLTADANELTQKLKEIEASYGTFSRDVGNYANGVADGMQKIVIKVGETERTFESARDASRQLNNELKSMAINGQQGTKEYDELNNAVKQLNSTLKDVEVSSVAMDNLLDTMQGITAVASVGQGISALFGLDDSAIEQTIQKLVALQNVLQGIETINKQIQSQEGIGLILSKGNKAVDTMVNAIFGLGTASKTAGVAVKALSTALKGIGIGVAIAGIMEIINLIESWSEKQKKAAEEIEAEAEKVKKAIDDQRNAYVNASAQYYNTASRLSYLRTEYQKTNDQLEKTAILKEASAEFKKLGINVKGVTDAQTMLVKNGSKVIELIRLQGDAAAISSLRMEAFKKSFNMLLENGYDANSASILAAYNKDVIALDKRLDAINPKLTKLKQELGVDESVKSNGKKTEDAIKKVEQNINNARINAMKDGLVKTLTQLQIERNRRIEEAKKTGRMVADQVRLINQEFDQKERDARLKYHIENLEAEKKYQEELLNIQKDTNQKMYENSRLINERKLNEKRNKLDYELEGEGDRERTINTLTYNYERKYDKKTVDEWIKLNEKIKETETNLKLFYQENASLVNGFTWEHYRDELQKLDKELDDFKKKHPSIELEAENVISATLSGAFEQRLNLRQYYYDQLNKATEEYYKKELETTKSALKDETQDILDEEEKRHNALVKMFDVADSVPQNQLIDFNEYMSSGVLKGFDDTQIGKYFEKYRIQLNKWIDSLETKLKDGKISIEEYAEITGSTLYQSYIKTKNNYDEFIELYNKSTTKHTEKEEKELEEWTNSMNAAWLDYMRKVEQENETHQNRIKVITSNGEEQIKKAEAEILEERMRNNAEYFSNMSNEYERALSAVRNAISKQAKTNALGIFNYRQERQNLKDLQTANVGVMNKIAKDKENLIEKLKNKKITFADFDTAMDNLNALGTQAEDVASQLSDKIKELPGEWWKTIDQWVQLVGQAATQVIQSIGQINDAAFEKQMEALDKQSEALEKQLDKQRELTQKYADDVDSIEDELATSRGDRRQFLIDQLNAQMAAQRESLAQEKRIEKEQERIDRKKKDLEYQNEVRKWEQSKLTAAINAALAISNAAVNNWPIPAVPMMALATAVGAAQMAAVAAAKPKKYAEGGLLQGKSHAQGGIKAMGGKVELEGDEFVVNKKTTMQNLPLMHFINSKKKKIDISDMIDFYSSGIKKNISIPNKTKFADGGVIPTLRSDVDLEGNVLRAIEKYSERPQVVQVVDILNKADNLKKVQVIAGLKPSSI